MSDLTIMYITANEMPECWMEFQLRHLMKAAGEYPIISVSRKPMDLGLNVLDEAPEKSYWNIYVQMRRAAELAETPYVAMAEDDTLYHPDHFNQFRPGAGEVSYNRARWSLFTWDPMYCLRQRLSNCSMIGDRKYLLAALREREKKYPNGCEFTGEVGRHKIERRLGVSTRTKVEWFSSNPVIQLNHPDGIDETQKTQWKRRGQIKAWDIPYWGRATKVVGEYFG
jgi:hypothetical protein